MTDFVRVPPKVAEDVRGGVVSVYRGAFTLPPYEEGEEDVEAFGKPFLRHAERDGFRLVVAYEGRDLVDFAYGFDGGEDGWTRGIVEPFLSESEVERWLSDYFEFVDFAVSPEARGRGVGGRLHDELLTGLSHRTAALFAVREAGAAMGLYRKRGWVFIIEGFRFFEEGRAYKVMGFDLRRR